MTFSRKKEKTKHLEEIKESNNYHSKNTNYET